MNRLLRRYVALACAGVSASVMALTLWSSRPDVRTEDRDGDGRPDVWRLYDGQGQLVELAIDSNFDGRSDVREFYRWGALVRRESDRKFTGRVDYVEEFDAATHERIRSVADTDDDGMADVLVLFLGGRPVFTKRMPGAPHAVAVRRNPAGEAQSPWGETVPTPLADPFRGDAAIRSAWPDESLSASASLWIAVGLPARYPLAISWTRPAVDVVDLATAGAHGAPLGPPSPRGPPAA